MIQRSNAVDEVLALSDRFVQDQSFPIKNYPVTANWASQLGHPCDRYLYHNRVDWENKKPRDWKGVGIRGNLIADWWKRYMSEKGYQVTEAERPLSQVLRDQYKISGKIDGRIGFPGIAKPRIFEAKTTQPYEFEKLNSYEDIAENKKDYIRGYIAQLQIYLFDMNEEAGLFIIINASTLEWKPIPVYLDYGYCEWLLQRAERVNEAVLKKSPPERIPYGSTCQRCDYAHICLPDIKNEGLEFQDQEHLVSLLNDSKQLKPAHDEYEVKHQEAKEIAKAIGKDCIVGGEYKIELKTITTTRIDTKAIPIEERTKYEVESTQTRVEFIPLGKE